jgi:hypothetical protein
MQQPVRRVVAVATAALVAGTLVLLALPGDARDQRGVARAPSAFRAEPPTSLSPRPTSSCAEVSHAFAPRTITVAGVTRGATVVMPPRDADGVPGVPPLTTEGKHVFAWDRAQGIRPGDPAGNVLLNAHTWPDGSALGNRLLAGLQGGDRIVVQGDEARLCYRVTERVEVLAERGLARYYDAEGPPQLAIVVCSGRRLGPGEWEKRTVWFASPAA